MEKLWCVSSFVKEFFYLLLSFWFFLSYNLLHSSKPLDELALELFINQWKAEI